MEISDCIWDEDFLGCEDLGSIEPSLVSTSIPSPGLPPYQWADTPLADEADNSDMTPQCMPVIDPIFVRENFIEDCLIDGVSDVIVTGDDVISEYLTDREISDQFSTLHVLVCGFCHSVFHVLDEFKSHLVTCNGKGRNEENTSYDSTSAVALVLWTNTVLRRVRESLSELVDTGQLTQRIQARWWRLSKRSRQVWEKSAEALCELAKVGSLVFPSADLRPVNRGVAEGIKDQLRWFGPQDLEGGDEIEMLGTIKVETNEDVANTNSADLIISHNSEDTLTNPVNNPTAFHPPADPPSGESSRSTCSGSVEPEPGGRRKWKHQTRARDGRWHSKLHELKRSEFTYSCDPCDYKTDNPWKLKRHMTTSRHNEIVNGSTDPSSDNHSETTESETRTSETSIQETRETIVESKNFESENSSRFPEIHINVEKEIKRTKLVPCNNNLVSSQGNSIGRSGTKRKSAINASEKVQSWLTELAKRR